MRVQVLSARAKRQGVNCHLTATDLKERFEAQKGLCFYTDVPLNCTLGVGKQLDGLSVDRVCGELGYVSGNFVLCTNKANTVKNNLTLEELKLWLPSWYERLRTVLEDYANTPQGNLVARSTP